MVGNPQKFEKTFGNHNLQPLSITIDKIIKSHKQSCRPIFRSIPTPRRVAGSGRKRPRPAIVPRASAPSSTRPPSASRAAPGTEVVPIVSSSRPLRGGIASLMPGHHEASLFAFQNTARRRHRGKTTAGSSVQLVQADLAVAERAAQRLRRIGLAQLTRCHPRSAVGGRCGPSPPACGPGLSQAQGHGSGTASETAA